MSISTQPASAPVSPLRQRMLEDMAIDKDLPDHLHAGRDARNLFRSNTRALTKIVALLCGSPTQKI